MNHYFIGKLLNQDDAKKLVGKQSYITKNLNVPVIDKIINPNTKFAYLGYMDENTILKLQDKLNNIFEAISTQFGTQTCTYKQYGITGLKTTKKSIGLLYNCSKISNIIVPYIRSYSDYITGETSDFYPHISLLRIDAKDQSSVLKPDNKGLSILEKTYLPDPKTFTIDSIDILRGDLKIKRSGLPSRYDDMELKVIHKYMLTGGGRSS